MWKVEGDQLSLAHWCHPSSHTRPARSSVTQPDLQPRSILLLLSATLSTLLQLLFTASYLAPPPKHSHVEHFYSFSIFTLGFSWMGMQLGASPLSCS